MKTNDRDFIIQKIRSQYTEKTDAQTDIEKLKELDAEVKFPANLFGYTFGTLAALVMGAGMSLLMTDIGAQVGINNTTTLGLLLGIIGMVFAIINYPIYKGILSSRRAKYADRILNLSEKMMNK